MAINNAIDLGCPSLCREDGIEAEASIGEMEYNFVSEEMFGILDGLHVGVASD